MPLIAANQGAEPFEREVLGARFIFTPITPQMLARARRAAGEATKADGDFGIEDIGAAVSRALLMEGIVGWEEVFLPAPDGFAGDVVLFDDEPHCAIDCTPENKALLLSDAIIFDALDDAYVIPFVTRERAKNGPAASPNGTLTKATAAKTTAGRRAAGKSGAKRARTANTRSRTTT